MEEIQRSELVSESNVYLTNMMLHVCMCPRLFPCWREKAQLLPPWLGEGTLDFVFVCGFLRGWGRGHIFVYAFAASTVGGGEDADMCMCSLLFP